MYGREKMIVEKAYVTLIGWRYVLRFINKNGTMNKRTSAWGLYAKDIQKLNEKLLQDTSDHTTLKIVSFYTTTFASCFSSTPDKKISKKNLSRKTERGDIESDKGYLLAI